MDRSGLIAQKQDVRRRLERAQREVERMRSLVPVPKRAIERLEGQIEQWMAEEYQLRVAIDQSR